MKLRGEWTAGGVAHITTTRPVDVVLWERWSGSKISAQGAVGYEDMCRMVWTAARRDDHADPDFDQWLAGCEELDITPVTPTQPDGAPSGG